MVVYRDAAGTVKHVAMVESNGLRMTILTKDGDERLYRATFPLGPLRLQNDPLVVNHAQRGRGSVEFWKLDRITVLPRPVQQPLPLWIGGNSEAAMRRVGRLGDGWIPSFITPAQFRVGVEKTCAFAAEARRAVPGDHFGALVNFWLDDDPARARAAAAPFIPRGRVDEATLTACTAFGPPEALAERLEQYVAGGGSKFIVRPMGPPERMLEQLERLAAAVIPAFHRR